MPEPRPSLRYTLDDLLKECHQRLTELNELHDTLATRVNQVTAERHLVTDTIAALSPLIEVSPDAKPERGPRLTDELVQKIAEHQLRQRLPT